MAVTAIEDSLTDLQGVTDQLDKDEVALRKTRERFAEQVRETWRSGASIAQIQEVTGFSRGHVYELLGDLTKPHSEARRARRKRLQGGNR